MKIRTGGRRGNSLYSWQDFVLDISTNFEHYLFSDLGTESDKIDVLHSTRSDLCKSRRNKKLGQYGMRKQQNTLGCFEDRTF